MKLKKLWALILAISLLAGTSVLAFADEKEPYVTHDIPSSMKIGEGIGDLPNNGFVITYHNLEPGQDSFCFPEESENNTADFYGYAFGDLYSSRVDENGDAEFWGYAPYGPFYKPGTFSFQPGYNYWREATDEDDTEYYDVPLTDWEKVGTPIVITVEEPIIETNAPSSIKKGENFVLTTALTNTALTNTGTAYYLDENNYETYVDDGGISHRYLIADEDHSYDDLAKPAYMPSVEILEGKDIVSQTNQDYSNTLKSSETLSFSGTGTVKLKIKYNQFITSDDTQKEWIYNENDGSYTWTGKYRTYSPEKIITIQVTDDSVTDPSSDSDTDATDPGKEQGTDSVNPDVEDKNIDAKEPASTNSSAKAEQEKTDTDKPNTGDNNNVTLLIWTLIISAEAMGVLIIYKRKMAS